MKQILFNTEMVRAILDGRKTMTRRVVKPQPPNGVKLIYPGATSGIWRSSGESVWFEINEPCDTGDILWVRETWGIQSAHRFECDAKIAYKAGGDLQKVQFSNWDDYDRFIWNKHIGDGKWYPSIHMPREAARIFLRVTDLRCERLHDISADPPGPENQVVREGFKYECDFIAGWERTIKPADRATFGWDANPWVWVIEFERIKKEEVINGA